MKRLFLTTITALLFNFSFAQTFNTGNAELDKDLVEINSAAKSDLASFKENLSKTHNMTVSKIEELLKIMEPAEVVLAKDISLITKKPMEDVVEVYKKNKGKGWGVIAKEMGIKPGSPEFHALKNKMKANKGNSANKGKEKKENPGQGKGKKK